MIVSVPISQLPSATQPLGGSEIIVMNQGGTTVTSDLSVIRMYANLELGNIITPEQFGAKGDSRHYSTGQTTNSASVIVTGANFTSADVGKYLVCDTNWSRTIVSVTNTDTVVVSSVVSGSETGLKVFIATDDTAAIQEAIDYASLTAAGGKVTLSKRYGITGPLTINHDNIHIEGAGRNVTFTQGDYTVGKGSGLQALIPTNLIMVLPPVSNTYRHHGIQVTDMMLRGFSTTDESYALHFDSFNWPSEVPLSNDGVVLKNLTITMIQHAALMRVCDTSVIDSVWVCGTGDGFDLQQTPFTKFTNCDMWDNQSADTFAVRLADGSRATGFVNCRFGRNQGSDVVIYGNTGTEFVACNFEQDVEGGSLRKEAIKVTLANDIMISACHFAGVYVNAAINLIANSGNTIVGNNFGNIVGTAINCNAISRTTIAANTFDRASVSTITANSGCSEIIVALNNIPAGLTTSIHPNAIKSAPIPGGITAPIVGITGTLSQFNDAITDGNIVSTAVLSSLASLSGNNVFVGDQTIVGSISASTYYNLPSTTGHLTLIGDADNNIKGYSFDVIPASQFASQTTLTVLSLGNTVTDIGDSAFSECSGLSGRLIIPPSVKTIGEAAFYICNCFSGDLIIPPEVTTIGKNAFRDCEGITGKLVLSPALTGISETAFRFCNFTGTLTIPSSVTTISLCAFNFCDGFSGNLIIPNGVSTISVRAFAECTGFDGNLVISSTVSNIGSYAFTNCSSLTNIYIECSASAIASTAFVGTSAANIYVRAAPNTPSGWTIGTTQFGKNVLEWSSYPNSMS